MLSKYVLNSNWSALSSDYKFDKNVDLFNVELTLTGNLNLTYTPYLSNLQDFSNNNYSYLFLTKQTAINTIFNNKIPNIQTNKQVCLLANKMVDFLVSEETTFVKFNDDGLNLNNIITLSDDNFFEIDFISSNEAVLITVQNRILNYVCVDDITGLISIIKKNDTDTISNFELDKVKLNYVYDKVKESVVLYKTIQNKVFVFTVSQNNTMGMRESNLQDLTDSDVFVLLRINNLPGLKNNLSWVTYKKVVDEVHLDIASSVDIQNNFVAHFEYDTVKDTTINTNFLTLKNQLNILDHSVHNAQNIRNYTSLHTGGNREGGHDNISVSYTTDLFTQTFKSDKITWFHVPPNNNNYRPNINDVPFMENGAIAGKSPIYSDKIFKKAANYSTTSNMGNTQDAEHTGIWLCAWLSGGPSSAIWMDRFYNTTSFTPYSALRYEPNVNYSAQIANKYSEGISDVASKITLEPGAWYAYSRIGKNIASKMLSGMQDVFISNKFDSFKTSTKLNRPNAMDGANQNVYDFDGNSYGIVSTKNIDYYNNFNISFFATRDNWNISNEYQLFGNYIDSGLGLFNNNYVNPVNFHVTGKKVQILNNRYEEILTIDCGFYLNNSDFNVAGMFRRDFNGNFHIITSNNHLLEFNSNGTLVDMLSVQKPGSADILNVSNNLNYGVIYYADGSALRVNLYTNNMEDVTNFLVNTSPSPLIYPTIVIDSFNYMYLVDGVYPIIKGSNIYYKNITKNSIDVFNLNNNTINSYITSNETIHGYNFDKGQNTYVLLKDAVLHYNTQGAYLSSKDLRTNNLNITAFELDFQNLNDAQQCNVRFIDSLNNYYSYNLNNDTYKKLENNSNNMLSISASNNSFSNYNYIQSIISSQNPLPGYNFKLRLFNQLNYEDVKILNTSILGQNLNTGTHHFSINLNTLTGLYEMYIDGALYNAQSFEPSKYSFSNLFNSNIIFGSIPFYGGLLYSDFYKSKDLNTFVNDLKIEKFKFFRNSLNADEIKLMYFEKYPPRDLIVDLNMGKRNYMDTVTRTFKHKMQGSKSNLINLVINDSLITDKQIQRRYEMIMLKKLKTILPGYVKVNSIRWENNKDNDEKMLVGNFNVRNTLTNNIE